MPAGEYLHPGQFLYHGTRKRSDAESIMKDKRIYPSDTSVPAGASGVYLFSDKNEMRNWGEHVIVTTPKRRLQIYRDINDNPVTEQMRRQSQFSQEYFGGTPLDELQDYYDDAKFPLTEKSAETAQDPSDYLQSKGYHGHRDSLIGKSEVVIYNPDDLRIVKYIKPRVRKR